MEGGWNRHLSRPHWLTKLLESGALWHLLCCRKLEINENEDLDDRDGVCVGNGLAQFGRPEVGARPFARVGRSSQRTAGWDNMTNLVAITNMVLMALLPEFSDAAAKLKLPISVPIQQKDIAWFGCDLPRALTVDLRLRSGALLSYYSGGVHHIQLRSSYFLLQNPDDIPKFYGTPKLSQQECLELAMKAVDALGYTNILNHMPSPEVEVGPKVDGKVVPRYRFEWKDAEENGAYLTARVEVDAEKGAIPYLHLVGEPFERPLPVALAKWEPHNRPQPPTDDLPVGAEFLSPTQQKRYLHLLWPDVVEFLERIGQPKPTAEPEAELDLERTKCFRHQGHLCCQMRTRTGHFICYQRGYVFRYDAPDSHSTRRYVLETNLDEKDFVTNWVYAYDELVSRTRSLLTQKMKLDVERFGLAGQPPQQFQKRTIPGRKTLRRFRFDWGPPRSQQDVRLETMGIFRPPWVDVEVDAVTAEVKYLGLDVTRFDPKPEPDLGTEAPNGETR